MKHQGKTAIAVATATAKQAARTSSPWWGRLPDDTDTLANVQSIVKALLDEAEKSAKGEDEQSRIQQLKELVEKTKKLSPSDLSLNRSANIFGAFAKAFTLVLVLSIFAFVTSLIISFVGGGKWAVTGLIGSTATGLCAAVVALSLGNKAAADETEFTRRQRESVLPQFNFEDLERIHPSLVEGIKAELIKAICREDDKYKKDVENIRVNARHLLTALSAAVGAHFGEVSGAFVGAMTGSFFWVVLKATKTAFCEKYSS